MWWVRWRDRRPDSKCHGRKVAPKMLQVSARFIIIFRINLLTLSSRCTVCKELLEHVSSYEHNGRPYCHLDYHEVRVCLSKVLRMS